jgi:hypothetical protein
MNNLGLGERLKLRRRFLKTLFNKYLYKSKLSTINKHCLFLACPRSGHTLVASLLDAHPNAIISKGVDPARYIDAGFDIRQVFCLYLKQSERFFKNNGKSNGYFYNIPNQWNGRFDSLKVIGDKSGDLLTDRIKTDPGALERMLINAPQSVFIHVVRNPFDNISTIFTKANGSITIEQATDYFFKLCDVVNNSKNIIGFSNCIDVRIEELIANPKFELQKLCHFLDLDPYEDYVNDCSSIVFQSPKKTRNQVQWPTKVINKIEKNITNYKYLSGYAWES